MSQLRVAFVPFLGGNKDIYLLECSLPSLEAYLTEYSTPKGYLSPPRSRVLEVLRTIKQYLKLDFAGLSFAVLLGPGTHFKLPMTVSPSRGKRRLGPKFHCGALAKWGPEAERG